MERKEAYQLSEEEFQEIENLYEKKLALENLVKIIDASKKDLYERLIDDYGVTVRNFNAWWAQMSKKFNLDSENWYVDFEKQMMVEQK